MTEKQRRYLKDLAAGYGLDGRQVVELARAYGVTTRADDWGDQEVAEVERVIKLCGPGYQWVTETAAKARAEFRARQRKNEKRAA